MFEFRMRSSSGSSAGLASPRRPHCLSGIALVLTLSALTLGAHAEDRFRTPGPGTRQRREIVEAVRPLVELAYRQRVRFDVRGLESNGSYALLFVAVRDTDNDFIGPQTLTSERGELVEVDGWVFAILRKDASEWHVLESSLFDGIAHLEVWQQKYPVIPRAVFERVGLVSHTDHWDDFTSVLRHRF
jgi:hypothetical protein